MQSRLWLPVVLFVGGIGMIVASVASGEADVSLVVVFPVVSGSGGLFLLGTVFVVVGMLLGVALMTMGQLEMAEYQRVISGGKREFERPTEKRTKYGGVVLVGPVPIAFGSDLRTAIIMLIAGIVIAIVALAIILSFVD
jgi:uncharacterized protein (TIGR00304 family)